MRYQHPGRTLLKEKVSESRTCFKGSGLRELWLVYSYAILASKLYSKASRAPGRAFLSLNNGKNVLEVSADSVGVVHITRAVLENDNNDIVS
jgi:hypothetical protein